MLNTTDDLRIEHTKPLISPAILIEEFPLPEEAKRLITAARKQAADIIHAHDHRLLVVVGPCSVHDPKAALEYAEKLAKLAGDYEDTLHIIMRVYFEKPRTTVGWKGLINDPNLDGSFAVNHGLRQARELLLKITELQLPVGTEFLDTIIPQFISDMISWGAIGARTTESQIHRELASGLSMPVGFKNGTTGDVQIAIDAIRSASHPHHFLGVTKQGIPAVIGTTGNDTCHVILRGSKQGPNYHAEQVETVTELLKKHQLTPSLMVDCSHGNSHKDHTRQKQVALDVCEQLTAADGQHRIFGVMLESNLQAGRQDQNNAQPLAYGQSITDACIDLEETKVIFDHLAEAVSRRDSK